VRYPSIDGLRHTGSRARHARDADTLEPTQPKARLPGDLDKLALRNGLAIAEGIVAAEEHEAHDSTCQDVKDRVRRHLEGDGEVAEPLRKQPDERIANGAADGEPHHLGIELQAVAQVRHASVAPDR